jgi:hypothetical protein
MTPEQQQAMRREFEAWADKEGYSLIRCTYTNNRYDRQFTQCAWEGYQAAYTPRPDLEVVARIFYNKIWEHLEGYEPYDKQLPITKRHYKEAAQAVIKAIFKEQI